MQYHWRRNYSLCSAETPNPVDSRLAVGFACSARFFGHICSKTPNMGWIVDWRGWEGPEVPGMEVRFFPMAARSTVRGSQLEED